MTIKEIADELDFRLKSGAGAPLRTIDEITQPTVDMHYNMGGRLYDAVNPPLTPEQIGVSRPDDSMGESVEVVVENAVSEAYDMAISNFKQENQNRLPMLPWEEVTTKPEQILAESPSYGMESYVTGGNVPASSKKAGVINAILEKLPTMNLPKTMQTDFTGTRLDSVVSPIATGMRGSLNNALGFFRDDVNKGIDILSNE